jgi:ribulose-phosphate 3-epimerase
MKILSPSLLSVDFTDVKSSLAVLEEEGIKYLHLDVMDGNFVPSISFGMPVIASLRKYKNFIFDVHMMVEEPDRYVEDMKKAGADMLSVHVEACRHLDRTVEHIKSLGMKAGAVLNPATPVDVLKDVLPILDFVLLMSVNPGFGGQKYIPYVSNKIRQLAKLKEELNPELLIQVDGGVNENTVKEVIAAGADYVVAGSAVFNGDIRANVGNLKKLMNS